MRFYSDQGFYKIDDVCSSDSGQTSQLKKKLSSEEFAQVVEAIIDGQYSWACVLMLRSTGYNPLHYMPYRTYTRLLKQKDRFSRSQTRTERERSVAQQ